MLVKKYCICDRPALLGMLTQFKEQQCVCGGIILSWKDLEETESRLKIGL